MLKLLKAWREADSCRLGSLVSVRIHPCADQRGRRQRPCINIGVRAEVFGKTNSAYSPRPRHRHPRIGSKSPASQMPQPSRCVLGISTDPLPARSRHRHRGWPAQRRHTRASDEGRTKVLQGFSKQLARGADLFDSKPPVEGPRIGRPVSSPRPGHGHIDHRAADHLGAAGNSPP